ncbi:MAG: hypothetical protein H6760_03820 [Candidatus Nomurabacteria bacterium]|nr:MAG: hypothetical protein H6760_03820 [Candidatus Nomurabacteria bacterium]
MNEKPKPSLAEQITQEIKEQKLQMRPKAYFIIGGIALSVGLLASMALTLFFFSVVLYRLRVHQPLSYLGHGGIGPFIENVPWIPIFVAVVGITLGIWLMRKYEFSYKHTFLWVAVGMVGGVTLFAVLLDQAGVPDSARGIRFLEPIMHERYSGDSWVSGKIVEVSDPGFLLVAPNGNDFVIYYANDTLIRPDVPIRVGEWAQVLGDRIDASSYNADEILHVSLPGRQPRVYHYYRENAY